MILRVWRAKVVPERLREYRRLERERCLPMLRKQAGFLGVLFLQGAGDQAAAFTIWEDAGTLEALESSPSYLKTTRELAESGLLAGKQSVEIFEITDGALRSEWLAMSLDRGADRPSSGKVPAWSRRR